MGAAVLKYIQSFFFCSTTVQLWYLPALLAACFLVGAAYEKGMRIWQLLVIGGGLFFLGCIGDNWYWNEQLPMKMQELLRVYVRYFMTMRNGIFYGFFFVALGLWFAKTDRRIPFFPALAGSIFFVVMMLWEIRRCSNTNMVFLSAPAAFCIFGAASEVRWRDRKVYSRLRAVSQWVYLSHVYFFHFYVWTSKWNPLPATKKGITVSVLVPMVLFAWAMACMSERKGFGWLKVFV